MARVSIVGWLRKRRRLTRGPLAAGTLLSARMRSFLGLANRATAAERVVLHAPLDWRERMRAPSGDRADEAISNEEILNIDESPLASIDGPRVSPLPAASRTSASSRAALPQPASTLAPPGLPRRPASNAVTEAPRMIAGAPRPVPAEQQRVADTGVTEAASIETPSVEATTAAASIPPAVDLEISNRPVAVTTGDVVSSIEVPNEAPSVAEHRAEPSSNVPTPPPVGRDALTHGTEQASRPPVKTPVVAPLTTPQPATESARPTARSAATEERRVAPEPLPAAALARAAASSESAAPPVVSTVAAQQADGASIEPPSIAAETPEAAAPHVVASTRDIPRVEPPTLGDAERVEAVVREQPRATSSPPPSAAPLADLSTAGSQPARRETPDLAQPTEMRRARRAPALPPLRPAEPKNAVPAAAQPPRAAANPEAPHTAASDRTLIEWRKLLFEATAPTPTTQKPAGAQPATTRAATRNQPAPPPPAASRPAAPPRQPPTEPLRESTRRFLKPRVGIDPSSVPIVRGEAADRLLGPDADAAAIGETVILPSTHDERSPRTLGLLAHELTHVAQRRQPAFVPPVVRPSSNRSAAATMRATPRPSSEESLARHVEETVVRDAEDEMADTPMFVAYDDDPFREYSSPGVTDVHPVAPSAPEWGGLPAPWEPLPVPDFASPTAATPAPAPASAFADAPVHFAEHGRTVDGSHQPAPGQPLPAHDAAPPPDLDALARRVYDVLKRRLAAERRREG